MTVQRLRAPREDHAILAEPPLADVAALLAKNRRQFQEPLRLFDMSWPDVRRQAQEAALAAAIAYLGSAGEPIPETHGHGVIVAGHQPELFHPGVWIKNFALAGLARRHGAVPLNLVVDSDTAKAPQLHFPAGEHLATIPFDHFQGEVPYEERRVLDEALFSSLPERCASLTESWPYTPLLTKFWEDVKRHSGRTPLLGERLVAARRTWERRWGCHSLELPLSHLCRTAPFARFACHLLADLPRFHRIYNETVQAYRRAYGIRGKLHPVPDLAADGNWLEAPFWVWGYATLRSMATRRGRLFVRTTKQSVELRCGDAVVPLDLPGPAPERALSQWLELEQRGIKIRTRALTTTLYARMFLGDTFLHGIGGGKYDELTDALIERFYAVTPPRYLVLSATLLLPLPRPAVTADEVRRLAHERRDLWWNPERHVAVIDDRANQKWRWIERPCVTAAQRRQRFDEIRQITDGMREAIRRPYDDLTKTLEKARQALAVSQVLGRRDYAFCLYPEAELREFLSGMLNA